MTRNEILAMKPGRELDALVAEKVMGEAVYPDYGVFNNRGVAPYSTNIMAAWQVVEKMLANGWDFELRKEEDAWVVLFSERKIDCISSRETVPEAICKAALLAIVEKEADT